MAFQFVHLELYARKPCKAGRSVSWILDEADRKPGATPHVEKPEAPKVVFGVPVAEVRQLHDEACDAAKVTLANGKHRAVRSDQKTLATVVASHPATMDEMRSDPHVRADVEAWEARTVAWLRAKYGDALLSVIRHEDEGHPHIHAYILLGDLRASRLHPGVEAKRLIKEAGPQDGEDGKAMNRRGDVAYKKAMRAWQDSYWQAVGLPSGLTRLGPGKRRLSRDEWQTERAAVASVKTAQERASRIRLRADEVVSTTKEQVESLKAAALRQAEEAKRMHDAAEKREREARGVLSRAKAEADRILASARAEVSRALTWGGRLRGFLDGFRRSSIEEAVRRAAAADVERERRRAEELDQRVMQEVQRRREAEQRAENAVLSAGDVGRQRDRLRRQLDAVRDLEEVATNDLKEGV
ncbi:hypothetical protein [Microvirga sp. 2TAF3]|uniref:hypothetical protein n=1 Tax=Microvirga sp. 2TAF3 TaxID=3233014 RepID=UPI003F96B32D